jgi:hypothetical protein
MVLTLKSLMTKSRKTITIFLFDNFFYFDNAQLKCFLHLHNNQFAVCDHYTWLGFTTFSSTSSAYSFRVLIIIMASFFNNNLINNNVLFLFEERIFHFEYL